MSTKKKLPLAITPRYLSTKRCQKLSTACFWRTSVRRPQTLPKKAENEVQPLVDASLVLPLRPLRRPKTDAITIWIGRTTICWIQLLDVVHHTKLRRVGTISCILISPTCWRMANFTTHWYGKPWRRRLLLRIPSLRPWGIAVCVCLCIVPR